MHKPTLAFHNTKGMGGVHHGPTPHIKRRRLRPKPKPKVTTTPTQQFHTSTNHLNAMEGYNKLNEVFATSNNEQHYSLHHHKKVKRVNKYRSQHSTPSTTPPSSMLLGQRLYAVLHTAEFLTNSMIKQESRRLSSSSSSHNSLNTTNPPTSPLLNPLIFQLPTIVTPQPSDDIIIQSGNGSTMVINQQYIKSTKHIVPNTFSQPHNFKLHKKQRLFRPTTPQYWDKPFNWSATVPPEQPVPITTQRALKDQTLTIEKMYDQYGALGNRMYFGVSLFSFSMVYFLFTISPSLDPQDMIQYLQTLPVVQMGMGKLTLAALAEHPVFTKFILTYIICRFMHPVRLVMAATMANYFREKEIFTNVQIANILESEQDDVKKYERIQQLLHYNRHEYGKHDQFQSLSLRELFNITDIQPLPDLNAFDYVDPTLETTKPVDKPLDYIGPKASTNQMIRFFNRTGLPIGTLAKEGTKPLVKEYYDLEDPTRVEYIVVRMTRIDGAEIESIRCTSRNRTSVHIWSPPDQETGEKYQRTDMRWGPGSKLFLREKAKREYIRRHGKWAMMGFTAERGNVYPEFRAAYEDFWQPMVLPQQYYDQDDVEWYRFHRHPALNYGGTDDSVNPIGFRAKKTLLEQQQKLEAAKNSLHPFHKLMLEDTLNLTNEINDLASQITTLETMEKYDKIDYVKYPNSGGKPKKPHHLTADEIVEKLTPTDPRTGSRSGYIFREDPLKVEGRMDTYDWIEEFHKGNKKQIEENPVVIAPDGSRIPLKPTSDEVVIDTVVGIDTIPRETRRYLQYTADYFNTKHKINNDDDKKASESMDFLQFALDQQQDMLQHQRELATELYAKNTTRSQDTPKAGPQFGRDLIKSKAKALWSHFDRPPIVITETVPLDQQERYHQDMAQKTRIEQERDAMTKRTSEMKEMYQHLDKRNEEGGFNDGQPEPRLPIDGDDQNTNNPQSMTSSGGGSGSAAGGAAGGGGGKQSPRDHHYQNSTERLEGNLFKDHSLTQQKALPLKVGLLSPDYEADSLNRASTHSSFNNNMNQQYNGSQQQQQSQSQKFQHHSNINQSSQRTTHEFHYATAPHQSTHNANEEGIDISSHQSIRPDYGTNSLYQQEGYTPASMLNPLTPLQQYQRRQEERKLKESQYDPLMDDVYHVDRLDVVMPQLAYPTPPKNYTTPFNNNNSNNNLDNENQSYNNDDNQYQQPISTVSPTPTPEQINQAYNHQVTVVLDAILEDKLAAAAFDLDHITQSTPYNFRQRAQEQLEVYRIQYEYERDRYNDMVKERVEQKRIEDEMKNSLTGTITNFVNEKIDQVKEGIIDQLSPSSSSSSSTIPTPTNELSTTTTSTPISTQSFKSFSQYLRDEGKKRFQTQMYKQRVMEDQLYVKHLSGEIGLNQFKKETTNLDKAQDNIARKKNSILTKYRNSVISEYPPGTELIDDFTLIVTPTVPQHNAVREINFKMPIALPEEKYFPTLKTPSSDKLQSNKDNDDSLGRDTKVSHRKKEHEIPASVSEWLSPKLMRMKKKQNDQFNNTKTNLDDIDIDEDNIDINLWEQIQDEFRKVEEESKARAATRTVQSLRQLDPTDGSPSANHEKRGYSRVGTSEKFQTDMLAGENMKRGDSLYEDVLDEATNLSAIDPDFRPKSVTAAIAAGETSHIDPNGDGDDDAYEKMMRTAIIDDEERMVMFKRNKKLLKRKEKTPSQPHFVNTFLQDINEDDMVDDEGHPINPDGTRITSSASLERVQKDAEDQMNEQFGYENDDLFALRSSLKQQLSLSKSQVPSAPYSAIPNHNPVEHYYNANQVKSDIIVPGSTLDQLRNSTTTYNKVVDMYTQPSTVQPGGTPLIINGVMYLGRPPSGVIRDEMKRRRDVGDDSFDFSVFSPTATSSMQKASTPLTSAPQTTRELLSQQFQSQQQLPLDPNELAIYNVRGDAYQIYQQGQQSQDPLQQNEQIHQQPRPKRPIRPLFDDTYPSELARHVPFSADHLTPHQAQYFDTLLDPSKAVTVDDKISEVLADDVADVEADLRDKDYPIYIPEHLYNRMKIYRQDLTEAVDREYSKYLKGFSKKRDYDEYLVRRAQRRAEGETVTETDDKDELGKVVKKKQKKLTLAETEKLGEGQGIRAGMEKLKLLTKKHDFKHEMIDYRELKAQEVLAQANYDPEHPETALDVLENIKLQPTPLNTPEEIKKRYEQALKSPWLKQLAHTEDLEERLQEQAIKQPLEDAKELDQNEFRIEIPGFDDTVEGFLRNDKERTKAIFEEYNKIVTEAENIRAGGKVSDQEVYYTLIGKFPKAAYIFSEAAFLAKQGSSGQYAGAIRLTDRGDTNSPGDPSLRPQKKEDDTMYLFQKKWVDQLFDFDRIQLQNQWFAKHLRHHVYASAQMQRAKKRELRLMIEEGGYDYKDELEQDKFKELYLDPKTEHLVQYNDKTKRYSPTSALQRQSDEKIRDREIKQFFGDGSRDGLELHLKRKGLDRLDYAINNAAKQLKSKKDYFDSIKGYNAEKDAKNAKDLGDSLMNLRLLQRHDYVNSVDIPMEYGSWRDDRDLVGAPSTMLDFHTRMQAPNRHRSRTVGEDAANTQHYIEMGELGEKFLRTNPDFEKKGAQSRQDRLDYIKDINSQTEKKQKRLDELYNRQGNPLDLDFMGRKSTDVSGRPSDRRFPDGWDGRNNTTDTDKYGSQPTPSVRQDNEMVQNDPNWNNNKQMYRDHREDLPYEVITPDGRIVDREIDPPAKHLSSQHPSWGHSKDHPKRPPYGPDFPWRWDLTQEEELPTDDEWVDKEYDSVHKIIGEESFGYPLKRPKRVPIEAWLAMKRKQRKFQVYTAIRDKFNPRPRPSEPGLPNKKLEPVEYFLEEKPILVQPEFESGKVRMRKSQGRKMPLMSRAEIERVMAAKSLWGKRVWEWWMQTDLPYPKLSLMEDPFQRRLKINPDLPYDNNYFENLEKERPFWTLDPAQLPKPNIPINRIHEYDHPEMQRFAWRMRKIGELQQLIIRQSLKVFFKNRYLAKGRGMESFHKSLRRDMVEYNLKRRIYNRDMKVWERQRHLQKIREQQRDKNEEEDELDELLYSSDVVPIVPKSQPLKASDQQYQYP